MTFVQVLRVRLRRAARLATQLAELLDFAGFTFLAQLARAAFFVALLALLLVDLLVRTTMRFPIATWRFVWFHGQRLVRALLGALGVALLAISFTYEGPIMECLFKNSYAAQLEV